LIWNGKSVLIREDAVVPCLSVSVGIHMETQATLPQSSNPGSYKHKGHIRLFTTALTRPMTSFKRQASPN